MIIRELRVRYAFESAMHDRVVHAVITDFHSLKYYLDMIKEVDYELVGVDERYREEDKWMPLGEGWKQIYPKEKETNNVYLSFNFERRKTK